ncbi:MAG: nuclear transport factor 2 family protein [Steroidobacteraceae bacterium]
MDSIDPKAIQELLDKQAITEALMRYSRGIDRKDYDLLRQHVYWPEAKDDHVLYEGDVEGMLAFSEQFTREMPTHHFLGNVLIEMIDATHAFAETYHIAYHDTAETQGRVNLVLGGRYLDIFEQRGALWRIQQRTVVVDWFTRTPGTADWNSGLLANIRMRGRAKPADPLYTLHPRGSKA